MIPKNTYEETFLEIVDDFTKELIECIVNEEHLQSVSVPSVCHSYNRLIVAKKLINQWATLENKNEILSIIEKLEKNIKNTRIEVHDFNDDEEVAIFLVPQKNDTQFEKEYKQGIINIIKHKDDLLTHPAYQNYLVSQAFTDLYNFEKIVPGVFDGLPIYNTSIFQQVGAKARILIVLYSLPGLERLDTRILQDFFTVSKSVFELLSPKSREEILNISILEIRLLNYAFLLAYQDLVREGFNFGIELGMPFIENKLVEYYNTVEILIDKIDDVTESCDLKDIVLFDSEFNLIQ